MQVVQLRSEPQVVSKGNYQAVFGLREDNGPLEYVRNSFDDQGDIVVDYATGLTWQKSGSTTVVTYDDAQEYLQSLSDARFAGLTAWRLPTIPELLSLLEPELQPNMLYISPIFDGTQMWCWSADRFPIEEIAPSSFGWRVGFRHGHVWWHDLIYARGVCTGIGEAR